MFDLIRVLKAFGYSWKGLKTCFVSEAAFRQELFASIIFIPLAFYIGDTALTRALLIFSWLLIIFAELINSAIEAIIDRISSEKHELSAKAKDIGSALVLVAILNAIIVWGLIAWVKFF